MSRLPKGLGHSIFWILSRLLNGTLVLAVLLCLFVGGILVWDFAQRSIAVSSVENAIKRDCNITESVQSFPDTSWYYAQHGDLTITCESYDGPCHCTKTSFQMPTASLSR